MIEEDVNKISLQAGDAGTCTLASAHPAMVCSGCAGSVSPKPSWMAANLCAHCAGVNHVLNALGQSCCPHDNIGVDSEERGDARVEMSARCHSRETGGM